VRAGVTAIVVLYRPDATLLVRQFSALRAQVDAVVYYDNGGGGAVLEDTSLAGEPLVRVVGDGTNVGLASALNLALRDVGASGYALLLDQDSVPADNLVATLVRGFGAPHESARPVIAVGPAIVDELEGRPEYFTRLRLFRNRRISSPADAASEFFEVDFLITSGTMIDLAQLPAAGFNDESLFIDSVDFDWSFAATARGFALLATFSTTLSHRRGDDVVRTPGGFPIRVHSPVRLYYMHRNRVRLYTRDYVPLAWKVHDFGRMIVKLGLLMVFVPQRLSRLRAVVRGLADGVRQRGGAYVA
jgi:rhamnosyltransferase